MREGRHNAVPMKNIFLAVMMLLSFITGCSSTTTDSTEHVTRHQIEAREKSVIILHGLGRTNRSMKKMANALSEKGYVVVNSGYPSTDMPIEQLAEQYLAPEIEKQQALGRSICLVTHSMGGILARAYLARHPDAPVERIVMLAPPNQGSELIDQLKDRKMFRYVMGPAALQLSTAPEVLVQTLPVPDVPTGIIAGSRSLNPISSLMIPGDDDGKVSVVRTQLPGRTPEAAYFLTVPCTHTFLMNDPQVIDQTLAFLEQGTFIQ